MCVLTRALLVGRGAEQGGEDGVEFQRSHHVRGVNRLPVITHRCVEPID